MQVAAFGRVACPTSVSGRHWSPSLARQQHSRIQLFSSTPLFSLAQRCQFLITALASRNFLAHLPTNVYFLYPRNWLYKKKSFHNRRTCFCSHFCKKCSKYILEPAQWLGFPQLNIAHSSEVFEVSPYVTQASATCLGDSWKLRSHTCTRRSFQLGHHGHQCFGRHLLSKRPLAISVTFARVPCSRQSYAHVRTL